MAEERCPVDDAGMTRDELELLTTVRIASPCPMKWSDLQGDEKRRYCGQCRLHVHNLAALTTDDAVALLWGPGAERVCARVFYRLDGTVMTKDCPSAWSVGLAQAVRRVGPSVDVASALGLALVLVVAAAIGVLVLFGDNVRALFGSSTVGALAGTSSVVPVKARARKVVRMPAARVAVDRGPAPGGR
jgi:hypothetical protein